MERGWGIEKEKEDFVIDWHVYENNSSDMQSRRLAIGGGGGWGTRSFSSGRSEKKEFN